MTLELGPLLVAHSFLTVERPPVLWAVAPDDTEVVPLLGEMIAAALGTGTELGDVTLRVNNVVIDHDDGPAPAGNYVCLSIIARGAWPAAHCRPADDTPLLNPDLTGRLRPAGVPYAYTHTTGSETSVNVYLAVAVEGTESRPSRSDPALPRSSHDSLPENDTS